LAAEVRPRTSAGIPLTWLISAAFKLHFGWTAASLQGRAKERTEMLETIAIILIILWLLGMVSGYTLGNFIWVLLVVAVVLFLVRLISGRRVV
jgi:hypothetical protein